MRVLIAEDHELYRKALIMLFGKLEPDAEFDQVGTIADLEAACDAGSYDFVMLDIGLPDFGSLDLIEGVKQAIGPAKLVIVSGSQRPRDIRAAMNAGAYGYLPKSDPGNVTLKALDLILAGGMYFPTIAFEDDDPESDQTPRSGNGDLPPLTNRQRQLLELLAEGHANAEIAYRLEISEGTVRVHVSNLLKRLGVTSRTQAALMARDYIEAGGRDEGASNHR